MHMLYTYIPFTEKPHDAAPRPVSVVIRCSCSAITDIPSSPILLLLTSSCFRVNFPAKSLLKVVAPVMVIMIANNNYSYIHIYT